MHSGTECKGMSLAVTLGGVGLLFFHGLQDMKDLKIALYHHSCKHHLHLWGLEDAYVLSDLQKWKFL